MSLSYLRQMRERRGNKNIPANPAENTTINYNVLKKEDYSVLEKIKNRNSWLLVFAGFMFTMLIFLVVFYRFIINNESTNIDTATILTTLLAFFSIYLSATFYFKATEQSNQFYDRSFSHTRDIAKTLSAMEGKFGEALKNIEQYSTRLNDRFDNLPFINNSLQENVLGETQKNIQELIEKMKVGEITTEVIKEYEEKFSQIQQENYELKKDLNRSKKYRLKDNKVNSYFVTTLNSYGENHVKSISFEELVDLINDDFHIFADNNTTTEMINEGIFDQNKNLTEKGVKILELIYRSLY